MQIKVVFVSRDQSGAVYIVIGIMSILHTHVIGSLYIDLRLQKQSSHHILQIRPPGVNTNIYLFIHSIPSHQHLHVILVLSLNLLKLPKVDRAGEK